MRPLVRATTRPGWALTASRRLSALWLLLVAPGVIDAQTAAQRRAIDAYTDSLRTLADTGLLRREEGGLLAAAWLNRNDPFFHLRLAHVALRLGDLSGVEHYDDAASEFRTAGQLAPRWPYAWFGLGLAELALGARAGAADDRSILVRDAWSRAAFAFARATTLEPGFAPRLEGLVMEALWHRAPDRAGVIRDALLHSAGASRHPRLVLALGRVQRAMGDSLSLQAFQTLIEVSDSSALALLELGRTRLLYGHTDGLEPYLAGASSDDPAAVQEARADLLPLATPAELADYDLRRGVSRAAMVRRFWTTRDRLDFREDGERLGEHLRRLAEARRLYLVLDESGNERLDDRGRIYVRHGPPGDRASLQDPGVEPNESWRYLRDGRDIILHFVARDAPTDFRLVESVADISTIRVGAASATGAAAGLRAGLIDGSERLIRSRAALSPRYRDAPLGDPARLQAFFAEERAAGR
ncbi:MAG TPA: GWxTD domain-containing protein, partial [Gemmatimonadales bacterium]|nr:GWxTD domain-containing protein [Gemmatimonadales bacterium]